MERHAHGEEGDKRHVALHVEEAQGSTAAIADQNYLRNKRRRIAPGQHHHELIAREPADHVRFASLYLEPLDRGRHDHGCR